MRVIDQIRDIHNLLYDALCYLDDFLSKNKLKYFLSNGTLLGAAKYGDFIPWDDDVDVFMPREDYDKLMQMQEINNGTYRLLCVEQIPAWRMPYAKLSCEKTVLKEGEYDFGVPFGIAIDIFPIDNWSSNSCIAKLQSFRSDCLKRLLVFSIGGDFHTDKTGIKRLILKSMWTVGKQIGYEKLQKALLKDAESDNGKQSRYAGCRAWTSHLSGEVFPTAYFAQTGFLAFRDRQFPVIQNYEAYLTGLYGDWRKELPPDQQRSNHEIKVWYKDAE